MSNAVGRTRLIKDTTVFLKDFLNTNITDTREEGRPTASKFVLTYYPSGDKIEYPLITVRKTNCTDRKLGMQSEMRLVIITMEIRVWARNPTERDTITDQIYDKVRDNEITISSGFRDNGLHDLRLLSSVEVEDPENSIPKSAVMEYEFIYFTA